MSLSRSADYPRLDDVEAVAFASPDVLVSASDGVVSRLADLAATYYGFWNNGSVALLEATVSTDYIDQTLPAGRQQGPAGLAKPGRPSLQPFQTAA